MNTFDHSDHQKTYYIKDHNKYLHANNYTIKHTDIYKNFSDGTEQYFPEEYYCETTITEKVENNIIKSNTWLYQVFDDEDNCASIK